MKIQSATDIFRHKICRRFPLLKFQISNRICNVIATEFEMEYFCSYFSVFLWWDSVSITCPGLGCDTFLHLYASHLLKYQILSFLQWIFCCIKYGCFFSYWYASSSTSHDLFFFFFNVSGVLLVLLLLLLHNFRCRRAPSPFHIFSILLLSIYIKQANKANQFNTLCVIWFLTKPVSQSLFTLSYSSSSKLDWGLVSTVWIILKLIRPLGPIQFLEPFLKPHNTIISTFIHCTIYPKAYIKTSPLENATLQRDERNNS